MKKLWLTSLDPSHERVQTFMKRMKPLGLEVHGHFWETDLKKMPWAGVRQRLQEKDIAFWGILGTGEQFADPDLRYGLSLLAISVQTTRGQGFPIVILQTSGSLIDPQTLPTPLKGADVFPEAIPTLGAKLVALLHKVPPALSADYHVDIYGSPEIGQWFEVGPKESAWSGAMFGVSQGEILFHAVGPKGRLPSQTVLNYPMKGLQIESGKAKYGAWAVQNEIRTDSSYFIKIDGHPASIIFGPYATQEEAEVYVIHLK
jgi:hypothetical protein